MDKAKLTLIGIISILIGIILIELYDIKFYKKENNRLSYNIENINAQLDSVKDKNGEFHNTISVLDLKASELNKINSSLNTELENMRIKIKNLENATIINTITKYVHDTVPTYIVSNSDVKQWQSSFENNYVNANWNSKLSNDSILLVTDYHTQFTDTIITATEIIYKGWWFWRKPKEIRLHLKSTNPYSKFNDVQSIKFSK